MKIFDEYGIDNCTIELLEACTCNSKQELMDREAFYIQSIKCVNKNIPNRNQTPKEYRQSRVDHIKETAKVYRETHREEINEKQRHKRHQKEVENEKL